MNKKLLGLGTITLAIIMILTPMVGTVAAGKGKEKLYYEANIIIPGFSVEDVRTVPPGAIPPNTVFLTLHATAEFFTLKIDSEIFTPTHSADMQVIINVKQNIVHLKIWETYTFEGVDGTLEIYGVGRIYNYDPADTSLQMSDTKIVGHGTGYFEGVKISAEGSNVLGDFEDKIHIGTIMGWPGLT